MLLDKVNLKNFVFYEKYKKKWKLNELKWNDISEK